MSRLRLVIAVHEDLIPPPSIEGVSHKEMLPWKAEFDVMATLQDMGHQTTVVGLRDDLTPLRQAIAEQKPQVVFNLLEEFHGIANYDQHVVSYLELLRQPYTGCNPTGLTITRDKALTKKILAYHRIPAPRFAVFPRGRAVHRPRRLGFPLFVKSLSEHASLGIAKASLVNDDDALAQRVRFMHESVGTDAIAEEFVEGREIYVGVLGNRRLQVLPVWELLFTKLPEGEPLIATAKAKWDPEYQKRWGVATRAARGLEPEQVGRIGRLCRRVYRALKMTGYARMDLRLRPDGRISFLEANPNPNLAYGEDLAESAELAGIGYEALLRRIVNLGRRYRAAWRDD